MRTFRTTEAVLGKRETDFIEIKILDRMSGLILDEMTYAVTFGWIDVNDVVTAVRDRAPGTNVVITGRDAPEELIAIADTVTEMRKVKHAFDSGIKAIKGIEY